LHLKGSQKHAVEAVSQSAHARISLVCEQYRLSDKQLKCLPEYTVKSTAGFDAFLQKQFEKGAG